MDFWWYYIKFCLREIRLMIISDCIDMIREINVGVV